MNVKDEATLFSGIAVYDNINPKIAALYANERMVLDVGCGSGALGAYLKRVNPSATVYGVDISPQAGEFAVRVLDDFACVDLDNKPLPDYGVSFDLIVLGDVLEHLKRPDVFLRSLRQRLNNGGSVILSVPNVAHYLVRKKLLFGEFNYASTGILDRTHLRFFTYRTITELIEECGYHVAERLIISNSPKLWEKMFPRLVAVQFVFKIAAI